MSCYLQAQKLCQMIGEGKLKEAIDELYADDVIVIEATGESFQGKDTQQKRLVEWQSGLDAFHGGGVHAITANEDEQVTMVESWVDVTFKGAPGPTKFEEVAVQHWKDDKIVRERFYYNAPSM